MSESPQATETGIAPVEAPADRYALVKKRVLLSGYYGFDNLGDDLILEVLVRWLQSQGVEPVVLSEKPDETSRRLQVPAIERMEVPRIWEALKRVDGLISGGGGLFQDVTGLGSPIYYGGLIEMARWAKVPVAFFGQGVGPVRTPVGKWFLRRAARNSDLVVVRDRPSQETLQRLGKKTVYTMADPVWLWEPQQTPAPVVAEGDDAMCPSMLSEETPHGVAVSLRPFHTLTKQAVRHFGKCLSHWPDIQEKGVNLLQCQPGADIMPLSQLERVLKAHDIPVQWYAAEQTQAGIRCSEVVIGMRFHALLVAAKMGRPVISLSYDPKVAQLARQLGVVDFPLEEWNAMTGPALADALSRPNPELLSQCQEKARYGFSLLEDWLRRE